MPRAARACLVLVLGACLGLLLTSPPTLADSGERVTTVLQPGWNLAGWTEPEAPVSAIFDAVPGLEAVYAWDADDQRFRGAFPMDTRSLGDLETLTPGMGLWLWLGGTEAVTWMRPLFPLSTVVSLHEGWNLVVWAGDDRVATNDALRFLDDVLENVTDGGGRELVALTTGGAFWFRVSASREWVQGYERPLIEFMGDFSPQEKADRETLLDMVVAFYVKRYGVAVPELTVRFGDAGADMVCAGYGAKVVYLKEPCTGAIAHEYGHALQEYLATREESGQWGVRVTRNPRWLDEGVANHWSALFEAENGVRDFEEYLSTVVQSVRKFEDPLQSFEKVLRDGLHYNLASLATDNLVSLSSESALFQYYKTRSYREAWEDNFLGVFGLSTEAFYNRFEEHRARVAPPLHRFRGTILGPDGEPVGGVKVFINSLSGGEAWTATTGPNGAFDGPAPGGASPHELSLDFPFDDASVCHLGWYDGVGGVTTAYASRGEPLPGGAAITIRLPEAPSRLCFRIAGTVIGSGQNPLSGVYVAIHGRGPSSGMNIGVETAADGTFTIMARHGMYSVQLHSATVRSCTLHGNALGAGEAIVTVNGEDVTSLTLNVTEARREGPSWTPCVMAR